MFSPDNASLDQVESIIRSRRSIRKYKAEIPPDAWIESIITCASLAPSPSNSQPVRFVRIRSTEIRDDLHRLMIGRRDEFLRRTEAVGEPKKTKNLINAYFRYSEFMFQAPVLICAGTTGDTKSLSRKLAEADIVPKDNRGETDLNISLGLSLNNLMLKSTTLGLGTCVLTAPLVFLPGLEERIGVKDISIKCFVTVGFPDEVPSRIERKAFCEIYREI